jgi:hypothetical protein
MAKKSAKKKAAKKKAAPKKKATLVKRKRITSVGPRTKKAVKADKKKKAMAPGRRRSRTGRLYTETRANRAD